MKNAALFALLSAKYKAGKILFVDGLAELSGKTKDADMIMKNISKVDGFTTLTHKKINNVYMTTPKGDATAKRAFRNLPYMTFHNMEDMNPLDLANSRYMVITNPEATLEYLASKK
jgi:ribosomal protein L4